MTLSDDLLPIYDLEIALGNKVARIDEPAGTTCPLAIVFRDPLHFDLVSTKLQLMQSVHRWRNDDPHYPLEAGYSSSISRHAIAGPQSLTTRPLKPGSL